MFLPSRSIKNREYFFIKFLKLFNNKEKKEFMFKNFCNLEIILIEKIVGLILLIKVVIETSLDHWPYKMGQPFFE